MKYRHLIFNLIRAFAAFICLISMYVYPGLIKNSVKEALHICTATLIPALFPYLTCTRILCEFLTRFMKSKQSKSRKIFGFSGAGFITHLLGLISGFPSGAVNAGDLYQSGTISKKEAENIIAFSNCISPAFCIIVMGKEIMGSAIYGIILFLSVIISNSLCMLILRKNTPNDCTYTYSAKKEKRKIGVSTIIKDCSVVMLNICAYVTFFICIGNLLLYTVDKVFILREDIKALIASALEISAGTERLSHLGFGKKILLGSMLLSFGGISAIMQVTSVCEKYSLSVRKFILCKVLSAIISPIITFGIIALLPGEFFFSRLIAKKLFSLAPIFLFIFLLVFIIFSLIFYQKTRKNRRKI